MKTERLFRTFTLVALGLLFSSKADQLTNIWSLPPLPAEDPASRTYITSTADQRGLAYNPATDHLLVVNRAGGLSVAILDAATGAELGFLDVTDVGGGIFPLNMIGVADDGAIYAGNLVTAPSTGFPTYKLYRWEDESATPAVVFEGDPSNEVSSQRWGDSIAVRGAGNDTQILLGARANNAVAVLTTSDMGQTFSSKYITGAGANSGTLSVAFGAGNTAWLKLNGQPLRHVSFDLTNESATLINDFSTLPSGVSPIGISGNYLGAINVGTPDSFTLYNIADPSLGLVTIDSQDFSTDNANGNIVGSVVFSTNRVFALDTGNGILAFEILKVANPASIRTPPANVTALQGATFTLTVDAIGSLPLAFQWAHAGTNIVGQTGASLTLTNVQPADAGDYTVTVSNAGGTETSAPAVVTITPLVQSGILTMQWQITPGSRPYLSTDDRTRGIAYNPATTNVLLISRTGDSNNIVVINALTGEDRRLMNTDPSIVTGGTYKLNMVAVADDGMVYAGNLTTDAASTAFALYRWADDSAEAEPVPVFVGDPSLGSDTASNRRFGDTITARGAGANTQILLASRSGNYVAILTPSAGNPDELIATAIEVPDAPAGAFGLGLAFGEGNTFYAKGSGGAIRQISFSDPVAAQGTVITGEIVRTFDTIPSSIIPIAYDTGDKLLAGIALENPDNVRLYDLANPDAPVLVDQELFPVDNVNLNGTGSAEFGGGMLFALDTNNGLLAFKVDPKADPSQGSAATLAAGGLSNGVFTLAVSGTPNARYRIDVSTDLSQWTRLQEVTIDATGTVQITDSGASSSARFYRAVAL